MPKTIRLKIVKGPPKEELLLMVNPLIFLCSGTVDDLAAIGLSSNGRFGVNVLNVTPHGFFAGTSLIVGVSAERNFAVSAQIHLVKQVGFMDVVVDHLGG